MAIDTNVYDGLAFHFKHPSFEALCKVLSDANGQVPVLVPTIWRREVERHHKKLLADRLSNVSSALGEAAKIDSPALRNALDQALKEVKKAKANIDGLADQIHGDHETALHATQLTANDCAVEDVLSDYFNAVAPFEDKKGKKTEFPDAFALASLRAYAKANNRTVIVVVADKGCLLACQKGDGLIGISNLDQAVDALRSQPEIERLLEFGKRLESALEEMGDRFLPNFAAEFQNAFSYPTLISDQLTALAGYQAQWALEFLEPIRFRPGGPNGSMFAMHSQSGNEAYFSGLASVKAMVHMSLSIRINDVHIGRREIKYPIDLHFSYSASISWPEGAGLNESRVAFVSCGPDPQSQPFELPPLDPTWMPSPTA